jgi:hypothetical protein
MRRKHGRKVFGSILAGLGLANATLGGVAVKASAVALAAGLSAVAAAPASAKSSDRLVTRMRYEWQAAFYVWSSNDYTPWYIGYYYYKWEPYSNGACWANPWAVYFHSNR